MEIFEKILNFVYDIKADLLLSSIMTITVLLMLSVILLARYILKKWSTEDPQPEQVPDPPLDEIEKLINKHLKKNIDDIDSEQTTIIGESTSEELNGGYKKTNRIFIKKNN